MKQVILIASSAEVCKKTRMSNIREQKHNHKNIVIPETNAAILYTMMFVHTFSIERKVDVQFH